MTYTISELLFVGPRSLKGHCFSGRVTIWQPPMQVRLDEPVRIY